MAYLHMNKHYHGSGFPEVEVREETIPLGGRIVRAVWDVLRNLTTKAESLLVTGG